MFQHCSCSRKWVIISFIFQVIFSEDMKLKSRSLASLHVFSLWAVLPSIEGGTQVSYMSPPLNTLYLSYHQMLLILPSKSFFIISALFDILKSLLPTPCPRFIIIFHLNNCSRLPTWSVRSPCISPMIHQGSVLCIILSAISHIHGFPLAWGRHGLAWLSLKILSLYVFIHTNLLEY